LELDRTHDPAAQMSVAHADTERLERFGRLREQLVERIPLAVVEVAGDGRLAGNRRHAGPAPVEAFMAHRAAAFMAGRAAARGARSSGAREPRLEPRLRRRDVGGKVVRELLE